ncbi:MAG: nucleotidyltransferase family protein [Hyphomicrobiales bacterium]|nr:nucleotidyltransferase family protein [Hyphomicrobiales bacterium]
MVFAAGLGTRMRPLTLTTPKPLIKVAGKTLLDHVLDTLAVAGVTTAIVNVHYLGEQIIEHLRGRMAPDIIISDERARLLDQGGGIARVLPQIGDAPFLMCNTDAFWIEGASNNLQRLAAAFDPGAMDAVLLVASTTQSVGIDWQGDFNLDPAGHLTRRAEGQIAAFAYTGAGIIKPELFRGRGEVFRLAPLLFEAAENQRLYGVRLDGLWLHVGAPEIIAEAERFIANSNR